MNEGNEKGTERKGRREEGKAYRYPLLPFCFLALGELELELELEFGSGARLALVLVQIQIQMELSRVEQGRVKGLV